MATSHKRVKRSKDENTGVDLQSLSRGQLIELTKRLGARLARVRVAHNKIVLENQVLEELTLVDPLTGVGNRRAFNMWLSEEVDRVRRGIGLPVSLALLDLDHFKMINTNHSHVGGDAVLGRIGKLLRQFLPRATDRVARFGGEEFTLILPATGSNDALRLVEKLRVTLEETPIEITKPCVKPLLVKVTASFGLVTWSQETAEQFLGRAAQALQVAKENGRNRVHQS